MQKAQRPLTTVITAFTLLVASAASTPSQAQDDDSDFKELTKKLGSVSTVEKKLMVPMRDGIKLATDLYLPKSASGEDSSPVPTIFWRTPYTSTSSERVESS